MTRPAPARMMTSNVHEIRVMRRALLAMLVLDLAIALWLVWFRTCHDIQYQPYPHFLVDYHFGFIRRGLVGAVFSLLFPRVPIAAVHIFSVLVVGGTFLLYLALFRRDFGLSTSTLPLLVFAAGSPFFFKNFLHNLGYFDILGAAAAIVLLLLPTGTACRIFLALAGPALVLVHHLHFLLYLPTLLLIARSRELSGEAASPGGPWRLAWSAWPAVVAFAAVMTAGAPDVPQEVFVERMRFRALDPVETFYPSLWYSTLADELRNAVGRLGRNLLQLPLHLLLLAAHAPLIAWARDVWRSIVPGPGLELRAGAAVILLGYGVIHLVAIDHSRWFSNAMVCLWLLTHAGWRLPRDPAAVSPTATLEHSRRGILAWIVTLVPRVGTVTPI